MGKEKKPEITDEKLGDNPFLDTLRIPVNKLVMHGQYKPDNDGHHLPVEVEVEADKYCRVYVDKDRRLKMVSLSPRSKDLLLWIIYEVENGDAYIWINRPRYMKESGVKAYNTYRDALMELVRSKFLLISAISGVYWINPNCFFNGSRINAFPNNLKIK